MLPPNTMLAVTAATGQDVAAPRGGAPAQEPQGIMDWLYAFGTQPGVVEVLLAVFVVAALLLAWWRLARLVQGAQRRSALRDYLLGVEQALQGDHEGARKRLAAVLAEDPENHYARLLLGKVLTELGEPAQAHKHHLFLQRAFGIDSAENELLLAKSLLAAGQVDEAGDVAERALHDLPARGDAWEFVFRTRLRNGDFAAAARAGRRMLSLAGGPSARPLLAREVARAAARSGLRCLDAGDAPGARAALQTTLALARDAEGANLLRARLQVEEHGVQAAVTRLLAEDDDRTRPTMPLVATSGRQLVTAAAADEAASAAAPLVPATSWLCTACGAGLERQAAVCPSCGSEASALLREPELVADVASPMQWMDAIDENDAYVRRLVQDALGEARGAANAARPRVLQLRERAVPELLQRAWNGDERLRTVAIDLLQAMGPQIAPALFAASDALEQQRLLPIGSRSPAALVGRVVQGFDRQALPHVEALFASARPEHRKILIDFFVGLGDVGEFQIVLERFPPVEILHRFNKCDGAVLRRFLEAVPPGHFVAEVLLLEPTFHREEDVLLAIPAAQHPQVLERVLIRRGCSRSLARCLIARLGEPQLGAIAARILAGHGEAALDHLIAAYTDPEAVAEVRPRLADLLAGGGPGAADLLCAAFGPEPAVIDDLVRAVLLKMGDTAVAPLRAAYGHSGWLERIAAGLVSRHNNRRMQIVRALQGIGSEAARGALGELREEERDQNLKLRLEQALHELRPKHGDEHAAGGGHGQSP